MTDRLVEKIRRENYLLEIFNLTKNVRYVNATKKIIEFVKDIYRNIEPSHFTGKIIVFFDISDDVEFIPKSKSDFYDKGILNSSYENLIFQIKNREDELLTFLTL